nr:G-type lectin S-receptor-like serine/threonine-protein kinase SD2-5 [Lolium perenne]
MVNSIIFLLAFAILPTDVASSTATPSNIWNTSNMERIPAMVVNSSNFAILKSGSALFPIFFGLHTMDGHAFTLSVSLWRPGHQDTVIWSANPDNPVSQYAILNFTKEGQLLLNDGNGTIIWSTDTKSNSVAGMRLDFSGNLVLFDQNNSTFWQSFDHPTDTLVMGQLLCRGMNISVRPSNTKWPSARIYLSAEFGGLRYSYQPAAYSKLFAVTASTTPNCYAFFNGSFGFPNQVFSLPPARSSEFIQYMRLEPDGHLRLYEIQGYTEARLLFDVLSVAMKFCDYPMACGDYGVCSDGQCSCPSLRYFRPQNERHLDDGCTLLTTISCDHAHDHQLQALNNVSYFSDNMFKSLATSSPSKMVCKQSCLTDCSCRVALFQYYGNTSVDGYCLLLSEQKLISLAEGSLYLLSAYIKIQGKESIKRRIRIIVGSITAGFSALAILFSIIIWKMCKKEEEQLFDSIPGTPKSFSFHELKVATSNFSVKLGSGGFGSVFKGKIGSETIAVKRLEGVAQGTEEFLAEVMTIGRMHHHNLVRLIGFCAQKSHRLLVYEYLCNSSLDKWIFHARPVFTLSWKTRRNIIMAIARGLSYLHEECKEKIAHLDIKPQNILLDDRFNAKLSDFGLSKMINRDQSKVMTRMRGTRGYLAPEWLGSKITEKADIYSFGIVVVEIICGRENLDESLPEESVHLISLLEEKARSGQLLDLVDSGSNDMQFHLEEVMEAMRLAMWCLQVDSSRRPLMSTVAKVLEGLTSLEASPDYSFVPSLFASNHTGAAGSSSSYVPLGSHLSGPR